MKTAEVTTAPAAAPAAARAAGTVAAPRPGGAAGAGAAPAAAPSRPSGPSSGRPSRPAAASFPAVTVARAARLPAHAADLGLGDIDEEQCRSFQASTELVGRKWTASVLLAAVMGARRFVEYRAQVKGISDRLLSQRLRELEHERLLVRRVTPTTPVLITYEPTERALGLMRALHPLVEWSIADQAERDGASPAA